MKRTDATRPAPEHDAHPDAAIQQPRQAPQRHQPPVAVEAPHAVADLTDGRGTAAPSVQFGQAKQTFRRRWVGGIVFVGWCLWVWLRHGSPGMIEVGVLIAAIAHWSDRDLDHAARIEPGVAILRIGRDEERVPASEITGIRVEETPGWLTRSVYIRIERGRFDSFDVMRAKARNTPEGRRRLQAKADEAMAVLRGE